MCLGVAIYLRPLSSEARSSALKYGVPNFETGKIEDLPLPGGPATTIIVGRISRQNHDPVLPAYLQAGLCECGGLRNPRCQLPVIVVRLPWPVQRQQDNADLAFAVACSLEELKRSLPSPFSAVSEMRIPCCRSLREDPPQQSSLLPSVPTKKSRHMSHQTVPVAYQLEGVTSWLPDSRRRSDAPTR